VTHRETETLVFCCACDLRMVVNADNTLPSTGRIAAISAQRREVRIMMVSKVEYC
jgi:hypothetical protein